MCRYHNKIFCCQSGGNNKVQLECRPILSAKGSSCNARQKIPAMDSTKRTAIAGTFLLAAANAAFSRQNHDKFT